MPVVMTSASSSNTQLPVPVEIMDQILDNLDASSYEDKSLLACSYVNHTLRVLCQRRIFRDITISVKVHQNHLIAIFSEDNQTTGIKLLYLLNNSPHIAPYIQSLTITEVERPIVLGQLSSPGPNSISSYSKEFPLYIITARAKDLKKLDISFPSLAGLLWSSMEPKLRDFFTQLVVGRRLPALGFIPFHQLPMSLFFHCYFLEELQISDMYMDKNDAPSSKVKLKSVHLAHQKYTTFTTSAREEFSWFKSQKSAFDITGLRTLKVSYPFPGLEDMLLLCSNSLRILHLKAGEGWSKFKYDAGTALMDQGPILDLGSLQSLSELTIGASLLGTVYGDFFYETDLLYVFRALKTLPSTEINSPTFQVNLSIHIWNIQQHRLNSIAWSTLICGVLNEEEMRARWTNLGLQFSMVGETGFWNPRHTLDRYEDLKNLRLKGLLSY